MQRKRCVPIRRGTQPSGCRVYKPVPRLLRRVHWELPSSFELHAWLDPLEISFQTLAILENALALVFPSCLPGEVGDQSVLAMDAGIPVRRRIGLREVLLNHPGCPGFLSNTP